MNIPDEEYVFIQQELDYRGAPSRLPLWERVEWLAKKLGLAESNLRKVSDERDKLLKRVKETPSGSEACMGNTFPTDENQDEWECMRCGARTLSYGKPARCGAVRYFP